MRGHVNDGILRDVEIELSVDALADAVHHEGFKGVVCIVACNGNLRTASNLHLIGKGHINAVHLHLLYVTLGFFVAPIEGYRIQVSQVNKYDVTI